MSDSTLWKRIKEVTQGLGGKVENLPLDRSEVVLLPVPSLSWAKGKFFWLVGDYKHLTNFATSIRSDKTAQDFVADHHIRFGMRNTDCPPVNLDRQESYGTRKAGADAAKNFVADRIKSINSAPQAARLNKPMTTNRRSDRDENVRLYWLTQTAQSHHIVEYNNLHTVEASQPGGASPLDHDQLPCVLLAAEIHQRYISSALKHTHGMSKAALQKDMISIYQEIYETKCPPLAPLWQVSREILRAAGFAVPKL